MEIDDKLDMIEVEEKDVIDQVDLFYPFVQVPNLKRVIEDEEAKISPVDEIPY